MKLVKNYLTEVDRNRIRNYLKPNGTSPLLLLFLCGYIYKETKLGTGVGISWISRDRADESNYESKALAKSNYESSAVSSSERRWGEKPIFVCINGETGAKERSEAE
ncbi:Uncharacterized protein Fot_35501 [Forsythia ovata]|uniref:Uncharacterized protein n=1 Tax=Forsythia ovata TaxID=205694 RepID=A0ABD1SPJ0_9LAMI